MVATTVRNIQFGHTYLGGAATYVMSLQPWRVFGYFFIFVMAGIRCDHWSRKSFGRRMGTWQKTFHHSLKKKFSKMDTSGFPDFKCGDANSGVIAGVSDDLFGVNTSDGDCDVDYLGQSSKGYLNLKYENPATLCSLLLLQTCSIIKPLYPVGSNPISQGPSQMYLRC
ncbi:hypothetical protein Tco_0009788 [Tanacetum coccineum]